MIELRNVCFRYGETPCLEDVNLCLEAGERIGLTGPIGSGKTTLLHIIVGLLKPSAGDVIAFGAPRRAEASFAEVRRRAGLVFQDADDQLFCPTVIEDIAFGPLNMGRSPEAARRIALDTLDRVGLAPLAERVTYRLSGGEKRLVALATVLAMEPDVLLLDEPTGGLDEDSRRRIIDLLLELPQAMILISHDRAFIDPVITRRLHLEHGTCRA